MIACICILTVIYMNVKYAGQNKVMTELLMKELRNYKTWNEMSMLTIHFLLDLLQLHGDLGKSSFNCSYPMRQVCACMVLSGLSVKRGMCDLLNMPVYLPAFSSNGCNGEFLDAADWPGQNCNEHDSDGIDHKQS